MSVTDDRQINSLIDKLKEARKSRDELLGHLKLLVNTNYPGLYENAHTAIEKVEALKIQEKP